MTVDGARLCFFASLFPLFALRGGEGWGEVGDSGALAGAHLTLPVAVRRVPSLSPLKGGEGYSGGRR
jgi:hypothetical protein